MINLKKQGRKKKGERILLQKISNKLEIINKSKELEKSFLKLNRLDIIPGKLIKNIHMNKYLLSTK